MIKLTAIVAFLSTLLSQSFASAEQTAGADASEAGFITASAIWPDWWGVQKSWMAKPEQGSLDLQKYEVVDVWGLRSGCEIYFKKFEASRLLKRKFKLKNVTKKSECNLSRPEIKSFSFEEFGTGKVGPEVADVEVGDLEITPITGEEIAIFGKSIPGLEEATQANCDSKIGLCKGKVEVAFWTRDGQHVRSKHRMMVFQEDVPLAETPVKNSAKKLFSSGIVPKGTTIQIIRANVSWLARGAFSTTSCNAMWVGETTGRKPDKINWGCNSAKPAWEVKYRLLD